MTEKQEIKMPKLKKTYDDSVKEEAQEIINAVKDEQIKEGIIDKTPQIVVVSTDFAGKKLKISKGLYKNGRQITIEAGTKWEDVSPFLRKNIKFTEKDFN